MMRLTPHLLDIGLGLLWGTTCTLWAEWLLPHMMHTQGSLLPTVLGIVAGVYVYAWERVRKP